MDKSAHNSWIGRRLGGRYEILDVIGEGGMGVVYRAKQVSIDRVVAIKMMHARAAQDPRWVDRFHSEAKACSLLTHPNTVRLYDFGQTTLGNLYMVMEYLEGRSLRDVIQEDGPMPASRVLRILMQCSASLSEAHQAGVIHRDIKPENIIVQNLPGASDFIKLFDFSIAKRTDVAMTAAGMIFGTPQFMSPEQARGKGIDHRSDLYSLGVVAYAMLTASLPFHHQDSIEVLKMHQTMEVPAFPDYVPNSVARLVMACLEKEPSRRPATALALLEASKVWLTQLDPTLDVASDPVLKNTLISGHPANQDMVTMVGAGSDEQRTKPAFVPAATNAKTILSASGASALRNPPLSEPSQDTHSARTSIQRPTPVAQASGPESVARIRNPADSVMATMIHSGGGASPAGGSVAQAREPVSADSAALAPAVAPSSGPPSSQDPLPYSTAGTAEPPQYSAAVAFETPMPLPQNRGIGAFLLLCVLVAATFGAGGYYLTAMLR